MLALGSPMPEFNLKDAVSGREVFAEELNQEKPVLVIFLCAHCPYVRRIAGELAEIGKYYEGSVEIIGISTNDAENYPEDNPVNLAEMAEEEGFNFPILYDESQEVAADFTAACTPDFFLFDRERKLVYRGQLDESRPENGKATTGRDLREAIEAVLAGKEVSGKQKPSSGCSIKWKVGNEPPYYNR